MTLTTRAGKGSPIDAGEHDINARMGAGWPSPTAFLASTETGFPQETLFLRETAVMWW